MKTLSSIQIFCFLLLISCENKKAQTDAPVNYTEVKTAILNHKKKLNERYNAGDSLVKDSVLSAAKMYLITSFEKQIFPCWEGTKWDYNGTTETPREGAIACGYFVTTTLRDMGFVLNRYALAQMASESMILKFNPKVKRFSSTDYKQVLSYFDKFDNGLFVVGMDSHTGYILKKGMTVRFIHAVKFEEIDGVVSQEVNGDDLFSLSNYRVIGELFSKEMLVKWLKDSMIE